MNLSIKASVMAVVVSAFASQAAVAATTPWTSATPWGTAAVTDYASWESFTHDSPSHVAGDPFNYDNTPEAGISAATLTETSGGSIIASSGNLYGLGGAGSFQAVLNSATTTDSHTGLYDVYLRVQYQGSHQDVASLIGVGSLPAPTETSSTVITTPFGQTSLKESYWKWTGVSAANQYTFNFNSSSAHTSLDALQLATVAAVPEPQTYAMLLAGLAVMGRTSRRRIKAQ